MNHEYVSIKGVTHRVIQPIPSLVCDVTLGIDVSYAQASRPPVTCFFCLHRIARSVMLQALCGEAEVGWNITKREGRFTSG